MSTLKNSQSGTPDWVQRTGLGPGLYRDHYGYSVGDQKLTGT